MNDPAAMRWHYLDPPLVWLFPATYLVHIAEETWAGGGFPHWVAGVRGQELSVARFFLAHFIGFALMVAGVRLATRRASFGWIAVAIATLAILNALSHLAGSVETGSYSPGLITGVVLWVPLGQLTLMRAWYQASRRTFITGLIVGAGIEALVRIIASSRILG